jgi:hypothetical protein
VEYILLESFRCASSRLIIAWLDALEHLCHAAVLQSLSQGVVKHLLDVSTSQRLACLQRSTNRFYHVPYILCPICKTIKKVYINILTSSQVLSKWIARIYPMLYLLKLFNDRYLVIFLYTRLKAMRFA